MRRLLLIVLLFGALTARDAAAASHPDWGQMRQQIEHALHVPDPLPKTQAKAYGKVEVAPGVAADRVAYSTAYDLRVPAIVYHQSAATITQHPALIVVNGHGGDKSSWYAYWAGILYARAGAIVLTYDPIGEYERNRDRMSQTNEHDQAIPPDDMARRLSGLMITDVLQAVSYLRERPDVDPKRIAVLGYSMGSFVSSLACAVDTRIHACVLAGGGDLDGPNGYWDSSDKMCQGLPYRALSFLGERGPALFALNAKRGPTLVINGAEDTVVDIPHHGAAWFEQLRKETAHELGSSKDLFDVEFVAGGGHAPYFLSKPAALWLQEKLKFPDWTAKQIEAMPETKVGDWQAKNGVTPAVAPSVNNHHEGGLLALGQDIPAVSRDQLHAIPEAVWDVERDHFTYGTWVGRADDAIRAGAP